MRRIPVVLVLVLAATVWPATNAVAHGSAAPTAAPAGSLQADFNHDGLADLAVGAPFEDVNNVVDAGAVNVLYGTATGLTGVGSQIFTQDSPGVGGAAEQGDHFGSALAAGDFNHDGFADLAIGAISEDVGAIVRAGAVNVLYGTATGLTGVGSQLFTQDSPGVGSAPEDFDLFGFSLAAGDYNRDGFADLAVGVLEDVGTLLDAGAVNVLYGSAAKLAGVGSQLFTQDSPGVGGAAEPTDQFGFSLAAGDYNRDGFADLAIGVQAEDVGAIVDAGAVDVLYGSAAKLAGVGSQLFTQDSPGVGGAAEQNDLFGHALAAGDFDHDGFADLAIGAISEDLGAIVNTGAVDVLYGSAAKLAGVSSQLFTQDSPGVGSSPEDFDLFGGALAAGDFDHDGFADLAIGVPFEDAGDIVDAGAVNVLPGSAAKLDGVGSQLFTDANLGAFGSALAAGDFNHDGFADLAIGAPFEDAGTIPSAGAVHVLYGSAGLLGGLSNQVFTQDSPGVGSAAEEGDYFGNALAASGPQSATASPVSPASHSGARRTASPR